MTGDESPASTTEQHPNPHRKELRNKVRGVIPALQRVCVCVLDTGYGMRRRRLWNLSAIVVVVSALIGAGVQESARAQSESSPPVAKPVADRVGDTVAQAANLALKGPGVVSSGDVFETVENPDGTKTMRLKVTPGSAPDGKGGRRARSAEVVPSADGFEVAASEPVRFGGSTDKGDLVTVGSPGRQLRFGRPNSSGVEKRGDTTPGIEREGGASRGVRSGDGPARQGRAVRARSNGPKSNQISYDGTFGPGSKLAHETTTESVKESIILDAPPSGLDAPIFRFPMSTDGLVSRPKDGGFEFLDAKGRVALTIPAAFMFDARGGVEMPSNVYASVKMEIVTDAAGTTIVLSPSGTWLRDPARVYPVTIDPTVLFLPWNPMNLKIDQWGDNSAGATFGASTNNLLFGNWYGSQWRSYLQWDPLLFVGKTITKATLNLSLTSCDNQVNPAAPYANNIGVHKLTSPYFFGQAWPGPSFLGEVWAVPAGPSSVSSVDITSFVQGWSASAASNFGLMLDMGTAQGFCKAQRITTGGQQTYVEFTYNEAPSTSQEYGFLKNFSFETGQSPWQACSGAPKSTWSVVSGSTPSGTKYAKLRSLTSYAVSLCQAVRTPVGPTKTYSLIASVRSSTGVPISGRLDLLENGVAPVASRADFTTSGTAWQNVSVVMNGVNAANFGLQADIFTASSTADLDIDYVVLSVSNVPGTPPPPTPTTTTAVATTTTTAPSVPPNRSRLAVNQKLTDLQSLTSPDGKYLIINSNGALVVYDTRPAVSCNGGWCPVWASTGFGGVTGAVTYMQSDGNLVVYRTDPPNNNSMFDTKTNGSGANNYLDMQNDGNLVVYRDNGLPVWSWMSGLIPENFPQPVPVIITFNPAGVPSVTGSNIMEYNHALAPGGYINDAVGNYRLYMRPDGVVALYGLFAF